MSNKHIGSSLDGHLKEEGTFEEARALAIEEVDVWQFTEAMEEHSSSKTQAPGKTGGLTPGLDECPGCGYSAAVNSQEPRA